MIEAVEFLQMVSGLASLRPAAFLTPRPVGAWRRGASRTVMFSAQIGFFGCLQTGFSVRWIARPHSLETMTQPRPCSIPFMRC